MCTEIIEYTAPDEVAVCNLASIALPKFVRDGRFDHQRLFEGMVITSLYYTLVNYYLFAVTKVATRNLNKIIDHNYYPVPEARNSNMKHRPIGLGIQVSSPFALIFFPVLILHDRVLQTSSSLYACPSKAKKRAN